MGLAAEEVAVTDVEIEETTAGVAVRDPEGIGVRLRPV